MSRNQTPSQSLSVGQLARRWGVSADRVRRLIDAGHLPGAFTIPSAGRYGATLKIPLVAVIQAETEDWAVLPEGGKRGPRTPRTRGESGPALRHFPQLAASPAPDAESPGAAPG